MKSHIITKLSEGIIPPIFITSSFIIFLLTNTPIQVGLSILGGVLLGWYIVYMVFGEKGHHNFSSVGVIEN